MRTFLNPRTLMVHIQINRWVVDEFTEADNVCKLGAAENNHKVNRTYIKC